jgi:hypothetical protein
MLASVAKLNFNEYDYSLAAKLFPKERGRSTESIDGVMVAARVFWNGRKEFVFQYQGNPLDIVGQDGFEPSIAEV